MTRLDNRNTYLFNRVVEDGAHLKPYICAVTIDRDRYPRLTATIALIDAVPDGIGGVCVPREAYTPVFSFRRTSRTEREDAESVLDSYLNEY